MKKLLLAIGLCATVILGSAETDQSKIWIKFEGCVEAGEQTPACFFFVQDKETGTRCYAFRSVYHDGAAISCVK
jgi:hypothetical protein